MAHVLIVDDRPGNRDLVATLLAYHGHSNTQASDGADALVRIRAHRPDLVITDVLMPGLDGYELVRELRAEPATAAIPVIFYTANYLHDEIARVAQAFGVAATVIKGGDSRELLLAVQTALGSSTSTGGASAPDEGLIREHLRTVNAKLVHTIRDLEAQTQELRRSEQRFRQMAEGAPIGIVLGDPQGDAWYVNTRLTEITGTPAQNLLDGRWREHTGLTDIGPDLANVLSGAPARYRNRVERHDGPAQWLDVSLAALRDDDGNLWGTVGTVDDVTAIVEAEARQRELDARTGAAERLESLGRLAGGIAHDFNNILAAILAYTRFAHDTISQTTQDGRLDPETGRHALADLDHVLKAGDRAANLTAQLLAFGRPKPADAASVELNTVVREVAGLLARTLGGNVELTIDCADDLPAVAVNDSQLSQVVLNLAVNARDAMPDGGQLHITTAEHTTELPQDLPTQQLPAGQYVKLTVADTGQGIPADVVAHVCEPFYTTKPAGEGTGLGLSTVYGIVRRAHGHLAITSELSVGTTLDIYLPAAPAAPKPDSPAEPDTSTAPATGTILVVDDDETICQIVDRILGTAGYRVHTATSGPEAIQQIHLLPTPPDLLITDIIMPRMSGNQLARHLLEHHPDLSVLYISGHTNDAPRHAGADSALLTKPFTAAALLHTVQQLLNATVPRAAAGTPTNPPR